MVDLCRFNQSFTGHTTEMKTVTPQLLFFFNQQCFGAQLGSSGCDCQTAGTTTDDTDIVIIVCHVHLLVLLNTDFILFDCQLFF